MTTTGRLDPSEALAHETWRARRRSAFGLAGLLFALGATFFALAVWFTDAAHFRTFLGAAAAAFVGAAVVLVHAIRIRPPSRK